MALGVLGSRSGAGTYLKRTRLLFPYLLIAPTMIWIAVVILFPMASALKLGLYSTRQLIPRPEDYVGLHNYLRLLTDSSVLGSLQVTLLYGVGTVLGPILFGLGVALILNADFPGRTVIRAVITIPWALPVVTSVLIWRWMLDPQYGIVNYLLVRSHILGRPQTWLDSASLALPSVIAIDTWAHFPFAAVVILTALQGVDPNLYDAGKVDGAGTFQMFRTITLPAIKPIFAILGLFLTVWSLQRFSSVWLLTQGGPSIRTTVLAIRVYREAFVNFDAGYASAIASIGLVLAVIATVVFLLLGQRGPE
jgi:multiple sugar transport system permease protein